MAARSRALTCCAAGQCADVLVDATGAGFRSREHIHVCIGMRSDVGIDTGLGVQAWMTQWPMAKATEMKIATRSRVLACMLMRTWIAFHICADAIARDFAQTYRHG